MIFLGIDTSCYTTSIACIGHNSIVIDMRTPLKVASGGRGLRQSEGVFLHTRNLEKMLPSALSKLDKENIGALAVSSVPTPAPGSYMPVFLVGTMAARVIASALSIPLFETSHQEGHIMAALYSNAAFRGSPFIAMHISGGTTELLHVDECFNITRLGGSLDIHAGQLVDRIGVRMGCPFPAGKQVEELALKTVCSDIIVPSSVKNLDCSFSGAETRLIGMVDGLKDHAKIARALYGCLARTFAKMILNAFERTGICKFLLAGGVASSGILRDLLVNRLKSRKREIIVEFALPELSPDNAVGVALKAQHEFERMDNSNGRVSTDR